MLTYAYARMQEFVDYYKQLAHAGVCWRMLAYAYARMQEFVDYYK